jgi:hypothetical protein
MYSMKVNLKCVVHACKEPAGYGMDDGDRGPATPNSTRGRKKLRAILVCPKSDASITENMADIKYKYQSIYSIKINMKAFWKTAPSVIRAIARMIRQYAPLKHRSTSRRYTPESYLHTRCRENLESHIYCINLTLCLLLP